MRRRLFRLREATAASTEPALQRGAGSGGQTQDADGDYDNDGLYRDCPDCTNGMTSKGDVCPTCKGAGSVAMRESEVYYLRESVSQAYRDKAKEEGNALSDGSYPIKNASDLKDAAQLAASGHGNVAAARRLIARRAKELGVKLDSLPGFGKASESTPALLRESEPTRISSTPTGVSTRGDAYEVVLIREGKGNAEDGRYYTRHAVQELVSSGVAEGMQAYADHPSLDEEQFLPERSVRDLVGTYSNVTLAESADGRVEARAIFTPVKGDGYEWVTTLAEEAARKTGGKPIVGISLYGAAAGEDRERPDGTFGPVADLIRPTSGDIVTNAGAGGEFVRRLMESARAKRAAHLTHAEGDHHMKVDVFMGKLREAAKRLREADTDETRTAALGEIDGLAASTVEPEHTPIPDDPQKLKESAPQAYAKLRESATSEAREQLQKAGEKGADEKDAEIATLTGKLQESERRLRESETARQKQDVTISAFNAELAGAKVLRESQVAEDEQEFFITRIRESGAKTEDEMRAIVKQWQDFKGREQQRVRESMGLGFIEGNPGSTGGGEGGGLIDLSDDIPTKAAEKAAAGAAA